MSKQTALQWFLDKLPHSIETQFAKEIEQALQMERMQIVNAYGEAVVQMECYQNTTKVIDNGFSYYRKRYGGQDE